MKRDITQLREQGRKWLDPSYQDSFNTMQSTLTMLSERVENLHAVAEIRNSKLEVKEYLMCMCARNILKTKYFWLQEY